MNSRLPLLAVALAAAVGSTACLKTPTESDVNGGLPPDTLPLSIADSVITFSVNTTALYAGDSIQVFFTIRNNGNTNRTVQGSSSCTLTVRAFNSSGTQVSPSPSRVCTADVVTFATLTPGEVVTLPGWWRATDKAAPAQADLAPGVYTLEPFLDASQFQRTGQRLKVQIAKR